MCLPPSPIRDMCTACNTITRAVDSPSRRLGPRVDSASQKTRLERNCIRQLFAALEVVALEAVDDEVPACTASFLPG